MPDLTTEAWREAHTLIRVHGEDAVFEAAAFADRALDEGDVAGFHAWQRVTKAINDLQAPSRTEMARRKL